MKIIIFAGGYGTRMWPASRKSHPKQFQKIVKGNSFFQKTVSRFKKRFKASDIFVSTEHTFSKLVQNQAPEIPKENIILEPERRDNLGAIGLVTAVIEKKFPGEVMFFSWSDHFIGKVDKFLNAVEAAAKYTRETGKPTSIDEKPTYPSIHNGWLKIGKNSDKINGFKIHDIEKHVEKPDEDTARKYTKSGDYLIHTGYGAWRSDLMFSYFEKYAPKIHKGLVKIANAWGTNKQSKVLKKEYHKFEKQSIDYGLFEKLPKGLRVTIPVSTGWEDAGTWELFYKAMIERGEKNVFEGEMDIELVNSRGNLVLGPKGKIISVVGLDNIVVIDTKDGLLVCNIHDTDKVKQLFKKLEKENPKYVD